MWKNQNKEVIEIHEQFFEIWDTGILFLQGKQLNRRIMKCGTILAVQLPLWYNFLHNSLAMSSNKKATKKVVKEVEEVDEDEDEDEDEEEASTTIADFYAGKFTAEGG